MFHAQLAWLGTKLATAARMAATQLEHAMSALLDTDLALAERIITDDGELHELGRRIEHDACGLLMLQSPVASELCTVVGVIRVGGRLERMGDLARHVAELARLRHPYPVVPAQLTDQFAEMRRLAGGAGLPRTRRCDRGPLPELAGTSPSSRPNSKP